MSGCRPFQNFFEWGRRVRRYRQGSPSIRPIAVWVSGCHRCRVPQTFLYVLYLSTNQEYMTVTPRHPLFFGRYRPAGAVIWRYRLESRRFWPIVLGPGARRYRPGTPHWNPTLEPMGGGGKLLGVHRVQPLQRARLTRITQSLVGLEQLTLATQWPVLTLITQAQPMELYQVGGCRRWSRSRKRVGKAKRDRPLQHVEALWRSAQAVVVLDGAELAI